MSGDAEGAARAVLAERLSALRERSGRTYASLARRIGVSGSTLHRYCTGRTVPAEFAPVERLARLCGAPAEEREALHRLWILADRERVDRQGAAEAKTEPVEVVEPEPEPVEVVPAEVVLVEGVPVGASAGEAGPLGRRALPGTAESGSPRRPLFRSGRARRYGQGLGVLAAAVLVLALVAAFGGTALPGPDRRPSVAQRPGGDAAGSPEPSSSGSPTPRKPQGTPSGAPRGAPSEGPGPTVPPGVGPRKETLPRASGDSPDPSAGRVPFTWTAD
ncbi:helix-turn-helix transcriptional regulator, partial [Streptomyces anulatus]|uniref:helix-turn-helix domain-containing protein n=1 Tax=Streptomyces anulatus TaxID=1892 RepID=UPI00343AF7EB